ncbi:hypothetical protein TAL182_PC00418 (plasmid) [Rhizobium sp. TAL182]|nr:hypothetical protein TAL182_PC00418 [Rhizobium sp. TAL182]
MQTNGRNEHQHATESVRRYSSRGRREITHADGACEEVDEQALREIILKRACRGKSILPNEEAHGGSNCEPRRQTREYEPDHARHGTTSDLIITNGRATEMLAGQLSFVNDWRKPSCKQRREPETTTVHLLSFAAGVITPANASRLSELRVARTMGAKDLARRRLLWSRGLPDVSGCGNKERHRPRPRPHRARNQLDGDLSTKPDERPRIRQGVG